jgi:hypothetical protein
MRFILSMSKIAGDERFPTYAVDRSTMPAGQIAFVTKLINYAEGDNWYFTLEGKQSPRGYPTAEAALAALEEHVNAGEGER